LAVLIQRIGTNNSGMLANFLRKHTAIINGLSQLSVLEYLRWGTKTWEMKNHLPQYDAPSSIL